MSITLDSIELPARLFWMDRYSWSPIVQGFARTEAGVLIRRESKVIKGRPITLQGDDNYAWSTRAIADLLEATQQTPNAPAMTLTIHDQVFQVAWRFDGNSQPMTVRPLHGPVSNPGPDEEFVLAELRFITV